MEMNSVMATEIVAAEVEHIVLPQIVSKMCIRDRPRPGAAYRLYFAHHRQQQNCG